ncbi:hypothetical protein HNR19_003234 [Nocardioides thalensis]|uniref:YbaB/EbfC DNA-binding family protein n=1 Tax=Nocardioides thalensis TaxID=1914755 RepID=A0A853C687_9ACTN|nr:hypothetical protein [Nocardioides thalensis]NYJ02536.1 hypothetical protein [Nocardioides thalensis]
MASNDADARLERLRATDRTGRYTSNAASSGTDPDHSVSVTVDATQRVVHVDVLRVDAVRTPYELAARVAGAYRAALVARRPPRDPSVKRQRPVAVATPIRATPPTSDSYHRHTIREASRAERARRRGRPGSVTGRSSNDCVTVTLPPASSAGRVDADAAWLSNAASGSISRAVTEAFTAAYSERDR